MLHPWITCPLCGWTSFSLEDVIVRYCGNCDRYHDEMSQEEIQRATFRRYRFEKFARHPVERLICGYWGLEP